MDTTKKSTARGRPRAFDKDEAIAKAKALFHARGFDALSVADLTEAIGINPPSFYAAFGSKVQLYSAVLELYEKTEGLDILGTLAPDVPLDQGVAALLDQAAKNYSGGSAPGCMVIEGARGTVDPQACNEARRLLGECRRIVHEVLERRVPDDAQLLTDYIMMAMSGLSASARDGVPKQRLTAIAAIAARQLSSHLPASAEAGRAAQ